MSIKEVAKGYDLTQLLVNIVNWRRHPADFFQMVTGLKPRTFQVEFLNEVAGMKSQNIVILAGRGIGKTLTLAVVALWYVFVLSITERTPMQVVVLAGSLDQSKICFSYITDFISKVPLLQQSLSKEPTQREIIFKDGSWIRPLPASEKCFDEDTEVYTNQGFKYFRNLDKTEEILTLNKYGLTEWHKPLRYYVYKHDGLMYQSTNSNLDFSVTPEHKFPIVTEDNQIELCCIEDIPVNSKFLSYNFKKQQTFIIPESTVTTSSFTTKYYKGNTYCIEVPNHTLLIRRNSKVVWSGNSVRGHHPDLLILDETAQIEDNIIQAALPMTAAKALGRNMFSTTPRGNNSWVEDKWDRQHRLTYPQWKFFNWSSEAFLERDKIELLKSSMSEEDYRRDIEGLIYKRIGKVFKIDDLKACEDREYTQEDNEPIYMGVDWGFAEDPTAVVVVQNINDEWKVLKVETYYQEYSGDVLDKIEEIAKVYNIYSIMPDSTNVGECMRLEARGLPVDRVSFKGEKGILLAKLKTLIEKRKIKWNPVDHYVLVNELVNYVYNSKGSDHAIDALLCTMKANTLSGSISSFDFESIMREMVIKKRVPPESKKDEIDSLFKQIRR